MRTLRYVNQAVALFLVLREYNVSRYVYDNNLCIKLLNLEKLIRDTVYLYNIIRNKQKRYTFSQCLSRKPLFCLCTICICMEYVKIRVAGCVRHTVTNVCLLFSIAASVIEIGQCFHHELLLHSRYHSVIAYRENLVQHLFWLPQQTAV